MTLPPWVIQDVPKRSNCSQEGNTGRQCGRMLTVSYGTAMSAAEQSLPAMRRMKSNDRCQYRNGHGNTSLWTLSQAYRDQKDSMQFAWWSIA